VLELLVTLTGKLNNPKQENMISYQL